MIERIQEQMSLLLNSEILQTHQSLKLIYFFRLFQLAQYFAIIMHFQQNSGDTFHLNSIVLIFKATLLDYDGIPLYLGYFSSVISFSLLLYFFLLGRFKLNNIIMIKNIVLIYIGTLSQYFCLLQISITVHSMITKYNSLIELLIGSASIILILIQSFIGSLLMRNTYQSQTLLCKDQTFFGLLSQIAKFFTILFYFYNNEESNALQMITLISALLWTGLEIIDDIYNFPYLIGDTALLFALNGVKLACTIFALLNIALEFETPIELHQLLLGILSYYASKQIFRRQIYNKCLNIFQSNITSQSELFCVKISLYLSQQLLTGINQYHQFLSCNMINLHNKFCKYNCKAQVQVNILQCLISQIQSHEDEQLFLYKANYIAFVEKQYSLSLMKIKQYQINSGHKQTWHFKLIILDIAKNIQREIQQILYNICFLANQNRFSLLTSKDLVDFEKQELEILPMITQLVHQKVEIWQQQIRGFANIYSLQDKLITFSRQIDTIRTMIGNMFSSDISNISISLVNNIFHLRILSLYFSIIMNDQLTSYLCEKQIQIVYYFEQTLKQNELTSLALITDKISIIAVSLVKKQGDILNQNKQKIGNLFGYIKNTDYNGLLSINQIIPDFIGNIHNEMLTMFLQKGQSQFFVAFKQVFGKKKDCFVMPLQLQFINDFSVMDDFVIKGVIYQGQKQQDFVLFDDMGHIQGITQSLFETLIQENHQGHKIDPESLTKQLYIYYFIPEIFAIIQQFQQLKIHTQVVQFFEDTQFIVIPNLFEFHEDFSRCARKFTKYTMTDPALYASSYTNCSELTNNNVKTLLRRKMFMEIDRSLMNEEFASSATKFIQNNLDIHVTFMIKFQLSYYSISNERVKGFYIMEVLDYKKHFDRKMDSEIVYRDADSTIKQSTRIQGLFSQRIIQEAEFDEINTCPLKQQQNTDTYDNIRLDTNGVSSKKVIFLKPEIEQNLNDFIEEEKSKSSSGEKVEDYLSPPQSKRRFCKENDSVQQFQASVKRQRNNLSEMEIAINQSQSSAFSQQSSRASNYFHKLFQSKVGFYKNIKVIIVICLLTVIVNIFLCIFNSLKIYQNFLDLSDITNKMNVPLNLNRYFSKTATLSWIHVCSNFSLFNISQFQQNQNAYQLELINMYMFGNISQLYSDLITIEEEIPYILQSQGLYPPEQVKLTFFINYLELYTQQILSDRELNEKFFEALIILRYNVKNMYNITSYLMNYLQVQFQDVSYSEQESQMISTIINTFLMIILFILQFIYAQKIQIQNQTLSLLVGRVKEQEIQKEIIKIQYLEQSLQQIAGNDTWKKINFWLFAFQNDYDHIYNKKQEQNKKQTKTSNLNSRIKHINITYKWLLVKLLAFLITYLSFIWGFYALQNEQSQNIAPMIELDSQYVRFSVNVDLMVFGGMIIKTQKSLYSKLIEKNIFSEQEVNKFDDGEQILILFKELQSTFSSSMKSLFNDVISSMPTTADSTKMKNLINNDICLTLESEIPFCQFGNMTIDQFTNTYGQFNEFDDDRDYLSQGILGLMAAQANFYQQNYGYELDQIAFNPNNAESQSIYSLLQFNNIILSHFKDSYLSFVRFLGLLTSSITSIRSSNFSIQMTFIYSLGLLYFVIYLIAHYIWLIKQNQQIRSLKLSLVIIPNEQLFNGSIINVLRKIE